jgi:2-polyprenyl-3-methyl-5-hydroxy-6-metoxy-1,4-benzoquinol methylase
MDHHEAALVRRPDEISSAASLPACPVCGGECWSTKWPRTRLRACRHCGTILNDRAVSREDEESRYQTYSRIPQGDEDRVAVAQWEWIVKSILSGTPKTRKVLDIGCGQGEFLSAARQAGATVMGLELDLAAVRACRQKGLTVVEGSLFDAEVPPGPWDVITFWDVLDHLEHPAEALRMATRELAPDGYVLVRGRNGSLHARFKTGYAYCRPVMERLRLPDVSAVHRWGLKPAGYVALMRQAGLGHVRRYPGIPTPGDRYATFSSVRLASALKGSIRVTGSLLHRASMGRLYPFPSVLVSARRASDNGEAGS